jgi:protein tyrosine phosphatase
LLVSEKSFLFLFVCLFLIQGESSRIIRHFHFNTWPDFGVPDPPTTLIRFVRSFRDRVSTDAHKPIVVHCSAGVGRSGTFIALDRLIQQMQVLKLARSANLTQIVMIDNTN